MTRNQNEVSLLISTQCYRPTFDPTFLIRWLTIILINKVFDGTMLGDACIVPANSKLNQLTGESEPSCFVFQFGQILVHGKYMKYMYNIFSNLVGSFSAKSSDTALSQPHSPLTSSQEADDTRTTQLKYGDDLFVWLPRCYAIFFSNFS